MCFNKRAFTCEISGSHGGEYEVQSLLGCTAVQSNRCLPTFQTCVLPPLSGRWVSTERKDSWLCRCSKWTGLTNGEWAHFLTYRAARTSETSVNIYLTTRQYIPEDSSRIYLSLVYLINSSDYTVSNNWNNK
jgi:hypothetical protein